MILALVVKWIHPGLMLTLIFHSFGQLVEKIHLGGVDGTAHLRFIVIVVVLDIDFVVEANSRDIDPMPDDAQNLRLPVVLFDLTVDLSSDIGEVGWSDQLKHGTIVVVLHFVFCVLFEYMELESCAVVKLCSTNMAGVNVGLLDHPVGGLRLVDLFHMQL